MPREGELSNKMTGTSAVNPGRITVHTVQLTTSASHIAPEVSITVTPAVLSGVYWGHGGEDVAGEWASFRLSTTTFQARKSAALSLS